MNRSIALGFVDGQMRLLIVTPTYEPAWKYGGVITCNCTLARELVKVGVRTTVYTTNTSGEREPLKVPLGEPVLRGGVEVFYFPSTSGPQGNFCSAGLSRKLWETVHEFDLVYVVALWQWIGIDAARACRRRDIPMVVATKGGFATCLRKKSYLKKKLFHTLFLKRALRSAAALHLTNAGERADAGTWLEGLPFFYCPEAVDPQQYEARPEQGRAFRRAWNIPPQAPVVVSVGRPDWKKGIDLLIRALAEAPHWYLLFAGDPENGQAPSWQRLARKLGVADRVVWPGFLSGPDLLAALSAADLFALVSANENFGMAVVEAMLCGLPVMVSRAVGVWHDIRDQKFTFAVDRQVDSIVAALSRFEQERPGSGLNGASIRRFAVEKYAPPVVARRFLAEVERFVPALRAQHTENENDAPVCRSGATANLPAR
jgi:glycosyltransferase involved in cell wall biosynthesis